MYRKLEIKIYNGPGTSINGIEHMIRNLARFNNINIHLIGPLDFKNHNVLSKCDIFMILGGMDIPYTQYLNGNPNVIIKNYVINGGSFLGICAGAYYASSKVIFAKNTTQEIIGDRELKFYKGTCIGPILAKYCYNSKAGVRIAKIGFENFLSEDISNTYMHFNGGGAFIDAANYSDVEIIARYLNIKKLPAAIIKINCGNGKVILSGVHFEYCNAITMSYTKKKYIKLLSKFNIINDKVFDYIINMLLYTSTPKTAKNHIIVV